jgi:serine/threonine protein kinase
MCSTAVVKDKTDFLKEAELMKRFASPWHINVLRLLGVVTQDEPMMIILEYMENGDLRSFLRRR